MARGRWRPLNTLSPLGEREGPRRVSGGKGEGLCLAPYRPSPFRRFHRLLPSPPRGEGNKDYRPATPANPPKWLRAAVSEKFPRPGTGAFAATPDL
jgi:hypothetical protein